MLCLVKPTLFLELTAGTAPGALGHRIALGLPSGCTRISLSTLFQRASSLPLLCGPKVLLDRLADAVSGARLSSSDIRDLVIALGSINTLYPRHATSIIRWPSDGLFETEARTLDSRSIFSRDKTYLLVGLRGQIGQSLCEWMVSNGAGCVCLTSRHPNVHERWLESFRGTGATVKVLAMDVLDVSSIERVIKEIRASCPPSRRC